MMIFLKGKNKFILNITTVQGKQFSVELTENCYGVHSKVISPAITEGFEIKTLPPKFKSAAKVYLELYM